MNEVKNDEKKGRKAIFNPYPISLQQFLKAVGVAWWKKAEKMPWKFCWDVEKVQVARKNRKIEGNEEKWSENG